MPVITDELLLNAADRSVIECVEAFVRFRPGFHGDTGIRDYLYSRLMCNLPDGGTFSRTDGTGTLLVQAEWYTRLRYRNTGETATCGRFDLGIPDPADLDLSLPRALIAFECGRNKRTASLLRDCDAGVEHAGPEPADLTKLARELAHSSLRFGYALEFYDEQPGEAEELIRNIQQRTFSENLRIVVLVCASGSAPNCTFLPAPWRAELHSKLGAELDRLNALTCAAGRGRVKHRAEAAAAGTNRVTRQHFFASCSPETCALIDAVEESFGSRVKLVFGGSTMTINRRPSGLLLRIDRQTGRISDVDSTLNEYLSKTVRSETEPITCQSEAHRNAVLDALSACLEVGS